MSLSAKKVDKAIPKAEIKVGYNYHYVFWREADGEVEKDIPFILLVNQDSSKFYCPDTEYKDSIQSTPQGKQLSDKLMHEAIKEYIQTKDRSLMNGVAYKTFLYVFKSFSERKYDVYDHPGAGRFHYAEPFDETDWKVSDSIKNILGYDCFMAETDYHGRHWRVWFTPEIPVMDGPWKLHGLPGLILEASDSTGQHTFRATGIENSNQEMRPVYNPRMYDESNRADMLRMERSYMDMQHSIVKARLDLDLGPDLPPSEMSQKYDFPETDYRHAYD